MDVLRVGSKFPARLPMQSDGIVFNHDVSGPLLLMGYTDPSPSEIADIRTGSFSVAMCWVDPVILLLFRFGDQPWVDCTFQANLVEPHLQSRAANDLNGNNGFLLQIVLVDTRTKIIQALRLVSLTPQFSLEFARLYQLQLKNPPTKQQVETAFAKIFRDESDVWAERATAICRIERTLVVQN